MYVYMITEPNLFTVGFFAPGHTLQGGPGTFISDSDHSTREGAAERVNFLNGGGTVIGDLAVSCTCHEITEQLKNIYQAIIAAGVNYKR